MKQLINHSHVNSIRLVENVRDKNYYLLKNFVCHETWAPLPMIQFSKQFQKFFRIIWCACLRVRVSVCVYTCVYLLKSLARDETNSYDIRIKIEG